MHLKRQAILAAQAFPADTYQRIDSARPCWKHRTCSWVFIVRYQTWTARSFCYLSPNNQIVRGVQGTKRRWHHSQIARKNIATTDQMGCWHEETVVSNKQTHSKPTSLSYKSTETRDTTSSGVGERRGEQTCPSFLLLPNDPCWGHLRTHQIKIAGFVPEVLCELQKREAHELSHSAPPTSRVRDEPPVTKMRASPREVGLDVKRTPHLRLNILNTLFSSVVWPFRFVVVE